MSKPIEPAVMVLLWDGEQVIGQCVEPSGDVMEWPVQCHRLMVALQDAYRALAIARALTRACWYYVRPRSPRAA